MTRKTEKAYEFLNWLKESLTREQYIKCEKLIERHRIKSFYEEIARLEKNLYI